MSKEFSSSQKDKIWKNFFGNNTIGIDIFERKITKHDFEADHIYPHSKGGLTVLQNAMPLHHQSNEEKANNLNGKVNGFNFSVTGDLSKGEITVLKNGKKKTYNYTGSK